METNPYCINRENLSKPKVNLESPYGFDANKLMRPDLKRKEIQWWLIWMKFREWSIWLWRGGPVFPKFIHPHPIAVKKFEYPWSFRIPDLSLFSSELSLSSIECNDRFTAQFWNVNHDFHKLRLFNFSLTSIAFSWYIIVSSNLVQESKSYYDLVEA